MVARKPVPVYNVKIQRGVAGYFVCLVVLGPLRAVQGSHVAKQIRHAAGEQLARDLCPVYARARCAQKDTLPN